MNERFRKLFISAMAVCCSVLLLFPFSIRNVHADGDMNDISDILQEFPTSGLLSVPSTSSTYPYYRFRLGSSTNVSSIQEGVTGLFLLRFTIENSNARYQLMFSTPENKKLSLGLYVDRSKDGVTWSNVGTIIPLSTSYYTGEGLNGTAYAVYYGYSNNNFSDYSFPSQYPVINLLSNQNVNTILQVISYRLSDRPWGIWSSSSGGLHFPNGSSLNSEQRAQYEQIYIVMDVSQDNSVTEQEVNFYNSTYNTNYDYSEINGGDVFTELQFLEYIATEIMNGDDNPGGGSGTGGGSDAIGSGITVGDNSFTQSQTQTIEENAVNVTVNNDNSLNQENTQWLNSIINNNVGGEEQQNAFENAIGSISGFTGIARSFAGLAAAVLGFLPSWVTVLLGVMFAILFVFIVFRLIHLFI